jgi:hypothetical protein
MASIVALCPYGQNKDRSYTSMSLVSFTTVARSEAQVELAENRKANVCDSAFLAERGCLSRAESMRRPAQNHLHSRIRPVSLGG